MTLVIFHHTDKIRRMDDLAESFVRGLKRYLDAHPSFRVPQLAEKSGVSESTLRKLLSEVGHSPKTTTLQAIANACNLSIDAIRALGDAEDHPTLIEIVKTIDSLTGQRRMEAERYLRFLREQAGDNS